MPVREHRQCLLLLQRGGFRFQPSARKNRNFFEEHTNIRELTLPIMFLMTYEMIGQSLHEWLGIGMFLLFVIHHVLNRRWFGVLLKGKYTPIRIWQTVLVASVLLSMIGSMVSGVIISRSVLSFLPLHGGNAFGRKLHMLSGYWGFVLMSLHLGLHWNMMLGAAGKAVKGTSKVRICILRIAATVVATYGMYAFVKRDIGNYMLLKVHFVFLITMSLYSFSCWIM